MSLGMAKRIFCFVMKSSVQKKAGKQKDQKGTLALRMTKAESSLALVTGKNILLALSHVILLKASQQHVCLSVLLVIKVKKVHTFYKVKGLRSCEKTFGNCGVDFAKYYRY